MPVAVLVIMCILICKKARGFHYSTDSGVSHQLGQSQLWTACTYVSDNSRLMEARVWKFSVASK